jgi:hypothetical protein
MPTPFEVRIFTGSGNTKVDRGADTSADTRIAAIKGPTGKCLEMAGYFEKLRTRIG